MVTQRNATRNQSTADYSFRKMFIFGNDFQNGPYQQAASSLPNNGNVQTGLLAARAIGTPQVSSAQFTAALTSGQTMILGGLTFTAGANGATIDQIAAAFANLPAGSTTGAGTAYGAYSGTLTNFSTAPLQAPDTVAFTSTTLGSSTALAATGTGTAPTINTTAGQTATAGGYIPVTSANLANVVGIVALEGDVVPVGANESLQVTVCTKGDIDAEMIILPTGVTLDTLVGNVALRDVLERIGFHLVNGTVDNTKADN